MEDIPNIYKYFSGYFCIVSNQFTGKENLYWSQCNNIPSVAWGTKVLYNGLVGLKWISLHKVHYPWVTR